MKSWACYFYCLLGYPIMVIGAVYHVVASLFVTGRLWADENISPLFDEDDSA